MKKSILLASLFAAVALAACSKKEEAPWSWSRPLRLLRLRLRPLLLQLMQLQPPPVLRPLLPALQPMPLRPLPHRLRVLRSNRIASK